MDLTDLTDKQIEKIEESNHFNEWLQKQEEEYGFYTVENMYSELLIEYINTYELMINVKYNDLKNNSSFGLLVASISIDVVDLCQLYSNEKLSDDIKEKIFDKSFEYLTTSEPQINSMYELLEDIMNNNVINLKEDIMDELDIKQVDDLKDSYINN